MLGDFLVHRCANLGKIFFGPLQHFALVSILFGEAPLLELDIVAATIQFLLRDIAEFESDRLDLVQLLSDFLPSCLNPLEMVAC